MRGDPDSPAKKQTLSNEVLAQIAPEYLTVRKFTASFNFKSFYLEDSKG